MSLSIRWHGPVFEWSSYAHVARGFIDGLHEAGVDVAVSPPFVLDGPPTSAIASSRQAIMQWLRRFADERSLPTVMGGRPVADDGFDIARYVAERTPSMPHAMFTMCSTDRVSASWIDSLNTLDAVWVPSRSSREALVAGGVDERLLRVVGPGIAMPAAHRRLPRAANEVFRFVAIGRREPQDVTELLLDAFVDAFELDPHVRLTIIGPPPLGGQSSLRSLVDTQLIRRDVIPADVPIDVSERHLTDRDYVELIAEADAVVRVSRGEGWAREYPLAVACGVPVIATRWGGHLDYLDEDIANLVEIDDLVPIPAAVCARSHELSQDQRWAEPSRTHLVELLREVRTSHHAALLRAERGRVKIAASLSLSAAGQRAKDAIEELSRQSRPRPVARPSGPDASVVWRGIFYGAESFAVESRDYVLGLHDRGIAVGIEPGPGPGPSIDLDPSTVETLRMLRRRRPADRWIHVQHATPSSLDVNVQATATVARTMFETEGLPPGSIDRCNAFTEVWLPSTQNAEMFVRHGLEPSKAKVVPEVVPRPYFEPAPPFALPNKRAHSLLAVFDWQLRKGWDVLVRSYAKAFSGDDDITLYILTHSMLRYTQSEIRAAARDAMGQVRADRLPAVEFLDSPVPEADMPSLFQSVDAYVLPTRGEGWGRPFAAAMASGTPVVATDAGGQRHFMTPENSWLIPSRLVDVSEAAGIERDIYAGLRWFEPDEDALVELLRAVVAHADPQRTARARRDIEQFRIENVSPIVVDRLTALLGGVPERDDPGAS